MRVALVGDYNPDIVAHRAIPEALRLSAAQLGVTVKPAWTHTSFITNPAQDLAGADGIWCVPASPYSSEAGALGAIRFARESGRPFLGTCGGFQHALIEYARNVCGLAAAAHAETDPGAPDLIVTPLACSLVDETGEITLEPGSRIFAAYGQSTIVEGYHCNFGLNPAYADRLFNSALRVTARDAAGDVRAVELLGHPFFAATLFQPERRALQGRVPPLVAAFVAALGR